MTQSELAAVAPAAQGLQGLQAPHGPQAPAHGLHGLQGLQGPQGLHGFAAAQGLQGLHAPQGLHGLHGLHAAAHGLQGLQEARRSAPASSWPGVADGVSPPEALAEAWPLPAATASPMTTGTTVPASRVFERCMAGLPSWSCSVRSVDERRVRDKPLRLKFL